MFLALMLAASKTAFLALVFSLPFMRPHLDVSGLHVIAADGIYVAVALIFAATVASGRARIRWDPLYWLLLAYFTAMAVSVLAADDPMRASLKLGSQFYLLSLPVIAATLLKNTDDLKAAFRAWLAAAAVTSVLGAATMLLFYLGDDKLLGAFALDGFGTLPPGDYPRIRATFETPAILCNYLTVSLVILLASFRLGWIPTVAFWSLFAVLIVTAIFSLTPALGGIFLALGVWGYLMLRKPAAWASLSIGALAAIAFVVVAAVTPFLHSTAPFLIDLPGTDRMIAPSVRMMAWIESTQTFSRHPLIGAGLGSDAARVTYVAASGVVYDSVTDAHNVFLSIAAQCGILGLSALVLLILQVTKRIRLDRARIEHLLPLCLGTAWLIGFAYQGLTGSYEDTRHLWVLLGLFLAALRISEYQPASATDLSRASRSAPGRS